MTDIEEKATDIEKKALTEEILQVKEWIRETARRAERIEPEPALPAVAKEWADKNFWEFLKIANQARKIADSAYWITGRLDAIEREGGENEKE